MEDALNQTNLFEITTVNRRYNLYTSLKALVFSTILIFDYFLFVHRNRSNRLMVAPKISDHFRVLYWASVIRSFNCEIVLNTKDNDYLFSFIDAFIDTQGFVVVTIQNGNRFFDKRFLSRPGFSHFYNAPIFHSRFGVLSEADVYRYRESGSEVQKFDVIGSVFDDISVLDLDLEKNFKCCDVCFILNSDSNRLSNKTLDDFIFRSVQSHPDLSFSLIVKPGTDSVELEKRYKRFENVLIGEFGFLGCLRARVVVGCFSTLLRVSLGVSVIYPLNFDFVEDEYFDTSLVHLRPTYDELLRAISLAMSSPDNFGCFSNGKVLEMPWLSCFKVDDRPFQKLVELLRSVDV